MRNEGYTLVELLTVIVVLGLLMMIILPNVTKMSEKNDLKKYHEYENSMIEYARIYNGDSTLLTLNDLKVLGLNGISEDGCLGYVTIDYSTIPYSYASYISCGDDYFTTGYNGSLLS